MNITGGLCSWLACSLIKLEASGSITTLEHNLCQEDSLTGQNGWIRSYTISCSLGACFLGFALSHSLHYIYTRWSLSACSCSLHTLSPSPDLNKTSLASLSPHCCSKSQQDPSAGKGRRLNDVAIDEGLPAQLFTFHSAAAREGLGPLLLRCRPVAHRTTPQEP